MLGDSRSSQLRVALACTLSLMSWFSPNNSSAPGLTLQNLTSSRYGRASRKYCALANVALVTTLFWSSCMPSGIMLPLRPIRFMLIRSVVRLASEYSVSR